MRSQVVRDFAHFLYGPRALFRDLVNFAMLFLVAVHTLKEQQRKVFDYNEALPQAVV